MSRFGGDVTAKEIAHRVRAIADKIVHTKWKERSIGSRSALVLLVRALDAIVDNTMSALVLVSLFDDGNDEPDDSFVGVLDAELGPAVGYELAGRLMTMAGNVGQRAAMIESSDSMDEEDPEDHRGHGCRFDPELQKNTKTDKDSLN